MSESSSSGGMGICGIITVIFVLAKVFEVGPVAAWSWWWVFSPLLIGWGIVFLIFAIPVMGLAAAWLVVVFLEMLEERKRG